MTGCAGEFALAVVGMAGRFPGASSLDQLQRALRGREDLLTRYPPLPGTGRVPAFGVTAHADEFDAAFFAMPALQARMADPQHRMFLECAWEALEHAGFDPGKFDGDVGLYTGMSETGHARALREAVPDLAGDEFFAATSVCSLTGRSAYHLGLTGPVTAVQSGCVTSLVAVHLAGQALIAGECDLALAGAVSAVVPHPRDVDGPAGIISSDGHIRALDADADGVVLANGAGVLVLQRLVDALADGARIHAVIRGSALANDGARKPAAAGHGVPGFAAAIRTAYQVAGVDPDSVDYIDLAAGGTAPTSAIELAALRAVFPSRPAPARRCRLGSLKAYLGQTDSANGVIAIIGLALAMASQTFPGVPALRRADPDAADPDGPFAVAPDPAPWPRGSTVRRAGVSGLGADGTYAHVVLEEPPPRAEPARAAGPEVLVLSARTPSALTRMRRELAAALRREGAALADVAHTLQVGRRDFAHRVFVVADDPRVAAAALDGTAGAPATAVSGVAGSAPELVLLFADAPGGASGLGPLYAEHAAFRAAIDTCAEHAGPLLGRDLVAAVRKDAAVSSDVAPRAGRLLGFATQYALARFWRHAGAHPARVVSAGSGDLAAAVVAGALELSAAVAALVEDRPVEGAPGGDDGTDWWSARLGRAVRAHDLRDGFWSRPPGPPAALTGLAALVPPSCAALAIPRADVWADVWPDVWDVTATACLPEPGRGQGKTRSGLLRAAGWLWLAGLPLDWPALRSGPRPGRVPLPTYPFERDRVRLPEPGTPAPRSEATP